MISKKYLNAPASEMTHKRPASVRKLTEYIYLLHENLRPNFRLYWVTITTVQHKSLKTDSELLYGLKLWLQHRTLSKESPEGFRYINTVERQRETQDLHFHIVIEAKKDFDIRAEVARLAEVLGIRAHPAVFDVKRLNGVQRIASYIAKYVKKPTPKYETLCKHYQRAEKGEINPRTNKPYRFKPPYSSLFQCRTHTAGGGLGKLYRKRAYTFRISVPSDLIKVTTEVGTQQLRYHIGGTPLFVAYKHEYFTIFKYSDELWGKAVAQRAKWETHYGKSDKPPLEDGKLILTKFC
jgi:hypothetical protein